MIVVAEQGRCRIEVCVDDTNLAIGAVVSRFRRLPSWLMLNRKAGDEQGKFKRPNIQDTMEYCQTSSAQGQWMLCVALLVMVAQVARYIVTVTSSLRGRQIRVVAGAYIHWKGRKSELQRSLIMLDWACQDPKKEKAQTVKLPRQCVDIMLLVGRCVGDS